MNPEQLVDYLGDIDEHFIQEAAPGNRRTPKKWWALAATAAAALLLIVVCIPALAPNDPINPPSEAQEQASTPPTEAPGPGCAPLHVYYQGNTYFYRGYCIYELPDDVVPLGETNNVGMLVPDGADDLDANEDGFIYIRPTDDSLIYFCWKNWDTSVDGPEPILLLYPDGSPPETPAIPAPVEYPHYTRLDSIVRAADAIVEGTVTNVDYGVSLYTTLNGTPSLFDFDVYTILVTNVLSGDLTVGEEIQVKLMTGNGALSKSSEDNYLLFLEDYRSDTPNMPFSPISLEQGVFPIEQKFLNVPNDDSALFVLQGSVASPPHTYVSYPIGAVRNRLQELLTPQQYPIQLLEEIKDYLFPFMNEYGIILLDANELTCHLDIMLKDFSGKSKNAVADLVYEEFGVDAFINFIDGSGITFRYTDD